MPLTLYMDVHVPIVVTESLRRKGLDVLTSQDDGTATLDDETLCTTPESPVVINLPGGPVNRPIVVPIRIGRW